MSKRLLLLTTLIAAGACAHLPQSEGNAPLAARLNVTASGMDVGLNDRADVAVFAVTPGQGVELVYPRSYERNTYYAGWSTLAHNPAGRSRSYEPRLARFMSNSASTVLVLVASREPLDIRRFIAGASLERALGHEVYRSYDADAVIGGIARLTVPMVASDDWAMDVIAIPITRNGSRYALVDEGRFPFEAPYVTVYCARPGAAGAVLVHVEFAPYACAPVDPPAESDSTATTGTGDGQSASRGPITRRTFAPAEDAAARGGRERVDPAGRARADGREREIERRPDHRARAREAGADARSTGTRSRGTARGTGDRIAPDRGGGERATGRGAGAAGGARNP